MVLEALGLLLFPCFFPCLVIGIIMLISLLTCDYIEKFVKNAFCSIKNRRRRYREAAGHRHNQGSDRRGKSEGRNRASGQPQSRNEEPFEAHTGSSIIVEGTVEMEMAHASTSYAPQAPIMSEPPTMEATEYDDPPPYHECVKGKIPSPKKKID